MRVFITGATGFVGREILRQAHDAGHQIGILSRHPDSRLPKELDRDPQPEIYRGDVLDPVSLQGALSGADAVIHLVGIISEIGTLHFNAVSFDFIVKRLTAYTQPLGGLELVAAGFL